jgi:hypothetical protein
MLHLARQAIAVTLLLLFASSGSALAKDFVSMPDAKGREKNIQIHLVKYDGSTNGEMVVQVRNAGMTSAAFRAEGLFFVPNGDPEKAPQRLGASGAFTVIAKGKKTVHQEQLVLAAGEMQEVRLEVFCIDSHRSSPSSATKFSLASKRLPKSMQQTMKSGNAKIYKKNKGHLRKSKSAVQNHMWKTRDDNWVELEGERAVEKAPKTRRVPNPEMQKLRHRPSK